MPEIRTSKLAVSTNYEMDYDKVLPALDSTVRTAVYYNQDRDIIANDLTTVSTTSKAGVQAYSGNVGSAEGLGGEIGLQGSNAAGLRWNAAYTLTVVRDKLTSGPPVTPQQFNDTTPQSAIDFGLGYSWNKFEADVEGKWQSRYDTYKLNVGHVTTYIPVTISNYVTVSGRIGYQLTPSLTLAVSGQQLQAAQTIETTGLEPERRILFSATYGF
jgi:hypothetical protein